MTRNIKIIIGVLAVVALAAIITAVNLNNKLQTLKKESVKQIEATSEVQKMVAAVSQHMVLPADEVPTGAIVSDLSKLKGQPFFERAQLGDVVLVYANTRRAVLWRPSVQKIVEISAINFPSTVGQTPTAPATTKTTK